MEPRRMTVEDLASLVTHLRAYSAAVKAGLPPGERRMATDPNELIGLPIARWPHRDGAALGLDLAGVFIPTVGPPGINPLHEWASPRSRTTTSEISSDLRSAANVLQMVADRMTVDQVDFPVPDPTVLHPYVRELSVLVPWSQAQYSTVPLQIARVAASQWYARLGFPSYTDSQALWGGALSPDPPEPRQPRFRLTETSDSTSSEARREALRADLMSLDARSRAHTGGPDAPTLDAHDVGEWMVAWSDLLMPLEDATIEHAPETPSTHPERSEAPPVSATPNPSPDEPRTITVDDRVFAPIPIPEAPDVFDGAYEMVALDSPHDDAQVSAALAAAGARIALVDADGTEHPDADSLQSEAEDLHTPSWVAIHTDPDGHPFLYADCQGYIPDPMGDTMRRILTEELARHLVTAHARPAGAQS